jgi:hypothetical protein
MILIVLAMIAISLVAILNRGKPGLMDISSEAAIPEINLLPDKPKPCRATFERAVKGMTLKEAIATVGAPPGVDIQGEIGSDVLLCPRGLEHTQKT